MTAGAFVPASSFPLRLILMALRRRSNQTQGFCFSDS
jgi:hypothetical protein